MLAKTQKKGESTDNKPAGQRSFLLMKYKSGILYKVPSVTNIFSNILGEDPEKNMKVTKCGKTV